MIEQTYYRFGGEPAPLPTLAGISSFSTPKESREQSSNWLGWILLIGSLIGVTYFVYWWKSQGESEKTME